MKYLILIVFLSINFSLLYSQETNSDDYLKSNRIDLRAENADIDKNIIGFTVMHGSQKAEEAELALIKAQLEVVDTLIYIPEIDPAMGYYFNIYLKNGDDDLLKDLILTYKRYVPQEASVAMFNKWRELRNLSKNKHIIVYGLDYATSYRYFVKYLLESVGIDKAIHEKLVEYWNDNQTDYRTNIETPLKAYLQTLVLEYQMQNKATDNFTLYLIANLADTFKEKKPMRDSIMCRNYITMQDSIGAYKQFIRMGLFHMMKSNFKNRPPAFITQLIRNNVYRPNEIYTIIGLLNNSKVLLEPKFDENGKYVSYTETEDDFYTGQSFLPGVNLLTQNKLSDITFFELSKEESPFGRITGEIYSGFELLPNTTWADYFDSAILIDSSEGNEPIEAIL